MMTIVGLGQRKKKKEKRIVVKREDNNVGASANRGREKRQKRGNSNEKGERMERLGEEHGCLLCPRRRLELGE